MPQRPGAGSRIRCAAIPSLAGISLILLVAGCAADLEPDPADSPRAPLETEWVAPPTLEIPSDGTLGGATASLIDVPESTVESLAAPITGISISQTALVSATLGGVVTAGRHTVVLAPGALKKDTEITVVDVTGVVGRVECELYPEGLKFRNKKDVTLVSVTSDLRSPAGLTTYYVYSSGGRKMARDLDGVEAIGGVGVLVHLEHFSTYRIGKAGW